MPARPGRATPRGAQREAGDFTGHERSRLALENQAEVVEAQKRMGLINQVQEVIDVEGVYDPESGVLLEAPEGLPETVEYVGDDDAVIDATDPENTRFAETHDPFKDLKDPITQQKAPVTKRNPPGVDVTDDEEYAHSAVITVEAEYVVVRIAVDLEDFTYGAGNTYNFVGGRKYKLRRDIADWLDSKGYIYHGR